MADELVHRWSIGAVEVVRVLDENFALPADRSIPAWCVGDLCPNDQEVGIGFSALALAAAGTRIVVDPWLANDGPRTQPDRSERVASLLDRLAAGGFAPDDVDVVVNTHLDGIGWNTRPDEHGGWRLTFPNARYLYPADEVAAIERGEVIEGSEGYHDLDRLTQIELVGPPWSVAAGVELIDAPGHNFGHLAVRIESQGQLAIYPGHLVLTPFDVAEPDTPPEGSGAELAVATRRAILGDLAERNGVLLTTLLGGSGGGRVAADGDGYRLAPAAR